MKKVFMAIVAILLPGIYLSAQTTIDLKDAAKHVGETVTVIARVERISFYFRMEQRPVIFRLTDSKTTDSTVFADLTMVVNNAEKSSYLATGKEWYKKTVTITGTIVLNKGVPQIEITKPEQVAVIEKS